MMKKLIAGSLCTAMILGSAVGVSATETTDAYSLNYGFTMISGEESMQEDITVVTNGEASTASLKVVADDVVLELPQYVLATEDGVYINAEGIIDCLKSMEDLEGMESLEGIDGILSLVGVTDKWVKLAPIDLDALDLGESDLDIEIPEFTEEMQEELDDIRMSLLRVELTDEGAISFTIDNETVSAAAEACDEFIDEHLGFVADILTSVQDAMAGSTQVDIKPVFRDYIDAVAEGYAASDSSISIEDATKEIDDLIDSVMEQGAAEMTEGIQAIPVAELWDEFSVKDIVDAVIAETSFEAKVTVAEEEMSYSITVQDESIYGTIEGEGSNLVVTAYNEDTLLGSLETVSEEEGQITISVYDGEDALVGAMDFVSDENGYESSVMDADGNVLANCKVEIVQDEEELHATYDMVFSEELSAEYQDGGVEFHGYFTAVPWEDDGSLETPEEASDILEIVKNVSTLIFTSMQYEE